MAKMTTRKYFTKYNNNHIITKETSDCLHFFYFCKKVARGQQKGAHVSVCFVNFPTHFISKKQQQGRLLTRRRKTCTIIENLLLQEKPHKCSLCAKSFPTPGDLKSHMYVHSGSWPYKCTICSRGFSKHTNLKNHLFLHTGK